MASNFSFIFDTANEIRTNSRPKLSAIEWPSDVLPTPGGPIKQIIGERSNDGENFLAAKNSIIRSFAFLSPA